MEKVVTKPSVKRGRPAKISLDDIVNEAIKQLAQDPGKPLSLNALARALGVTPMALYRYVDDRDALLQEIAGRLLHDLNPQIPEASWHEQLRIWPPRCEIIFWQIRVYFLFWDGKNTSPARG